MGFFDNTNKIYSTKYITAEITDDKNKIHFVPIKITFDDMFIAEINKQLYAFTTKGARILRYDQKLVKSFGVIQYDTSHFSSIKSEFKEMEIVLRENNLGKMNRELFGIFKVLSKREKEDFGMWKLDDQTFQTLEEAEKYRKEKNLTEEPTQIVHDIKALIKEFETNWQKKYPERVEQIKKFLEELDVKQIVTPLKRVTDCLQEDFIATSPNFLASVIPYIKSVDGDLKKTNNVEIKGHKNLMKYLLIAMIGVAIVAAIYIAYDKGLFDPLVNAGKSFQTASESFQGLPSPTGGFNTAAKGDPYSDANIQKNYTPESLLEAINTGTVDYNKLSDTMKKTVDDTRKRLEVAP